MAAKSSARSSWIRSSAATFDRHSLAPRTLNRMPAGEIAVMVITAMVIFAERVAHLAEVTAVTDPEGTTVVYSVTGELFFASLNDLVGRFAHATDPGRSCTRTGPCRS